MIIPIRHAPGVCEPTVAWALRVFDVVVFLDFFRAVRRLRLCETRKRLA